MLARVLILIFIFTNFEKYFIRIKQINDSTCSSRCDSRMSFDEKK